MMNSGSVRMTISIMRSPITRSALIILLGISVLVLLPGSASGEVTSPGTVIACYMVGSTMESGYGSATDDISEMIAGYKGASPDSLDVVVAYGGSDKEGWKGMTIATLQDLITDMQDNVIGNEGIAEQYYQGMNMGSEEALFSFLSYISENYPNSRKILIFWDHGGSFYGVCFDENFDLDPLTLKELRQGLMTSRTDFDLIGMDACLMGSLEVASAVRDCTDYLLISEEVEPGHGWDYAPLISTVVNNPGIPIPDLGTAVINSYMEPTGHEPMKKTLSLLDISKLDAVITMLGRCASGLIPLIPGTESGGISSSVSDSQRFGYHPVEDVEVTIDLSGLARNLQEKVNAAGPEVGDLGQALDACIVYARNDGSRPGSHGISIISPRKIGTDLLPRLPDEVSLSDEWDLFLNTYAAYIAEDMESPVIEKTDNGRYRVIDNLGALDTKVSTVWVPEGSESSPVLIRTKPAVVNDTGYLDPGQPESTAFAFRDEKSGNTGFFWTTSLDNGMSGMELHHGVVSIQREDTIITAYIDIKKNSEAVGESLSYSFLPFESRGSEIGDPRFGILFVREPVQLQPGDLLTTYAISTDSAPVTGNPSGISPSLVPLSTIPITGPVQVIEDTLPGVERSVMIAAEDGAGNKQSVSVRKDLTPLSSLTPRDEVPLSELPQPDLGAPDLSGPPVGGTAPLDQPVPLQRPVSFTDDSGSGLKISEIARSAPPAVKRTACHGMG